MKNKKVLIGLLIVLVVLIIAIVLVIYNNDANKLKRFLKKDGYMCNSSICTKNEKDIIYQVNYKKGSFTYETQKIVINITKDMATLDPSKDSSSNICEFKKDNVNDLTKFTEEDTSNNCLIYLEKVNEQVNTFQIILVKSGANITKLSK